MRKNDVDENLGCRCRPCLTATILCEKRLSEKKKKKAIATVFVIASTLECIRIRKFRPV